MRPLRPDTLGGRHRVVSTIASDETRKPNLRGFRIYVGDFVDVDDPGNDPPDTSPSSPPFLNGFSYDPTAPLWFAHGLDGETDMGGNYDLLSGSPVSGTVAWVCPSEWRDGMPEFSTFPVVIEEGATLADDIIVLACQRFEPANGNVRVYWPLAATPYP